MTFYISRGGDVVTNTSSQKKCYGIHPSATASFDHLVVKTASNFKDKTRCLLLQILSSPHTHIIHCQNLPPRIASAMLPSRNGKSLETETPNGGAIARASRSTASVSGLRKGRS